MRIIAGEYRGRRLDAPKGQGTRPTTDRVRESLMSALHSARGGFTGAVVLDAFAGSGALALETLSRGADRAVLCERDREAVGTIERNLRTLGLSSDRARLMRTDVVKRPPAAGGAPFDLVFLDPPYALGATAVFDLIGRLDRAGSLAADVIISYEHDGADNDAVDVRAAADGWALASRRAFGDTVIDLLERAAEPEASAAEGGAQERFPVIMERLCMG